jgi:DNA-binding PadR family transcriptional regulator
MKTSGVSHVILGALRHGPRSGYEIKQLVDKSTRFFWAASYAQIYPELRRLADAGLIVPAGEPSDSRRRVRYRLTPAGRAQLERWLRSPAAGYELRDEGLLKLFFADAVPRRDAHVLTRQLQAERQAILDRLREIERTLPEDVPTSHVDVLRYGIEFHEWVVAWCARLADRLDSDEGDAEEGTSR